MKQNGNPNDIRIQHLIAQNDNRIQDLPPMHGAQYHQNMNQQNAEDDNRIQYIHTPPSRREPGWRVFTSQPQVFCIYNDQSTDGAQHILLTPLEHFGSGLLHLLRIQEECIEEVKLLFNPGHMLYNWPIVKERKDLHPYTQDASDIVNKPNLFEFG